MALYLVLVLVALCSHPVEALDNSQNWLGITTTTQYAQLSNCTQQCMLEAASNLKCWSYSCVCSGNDALGANYLAGVSNVTACASQNCGGGAAIGEAAGAFQQFCGLYAGTAVVSAIVKTMVSIQVSTVSPTGTFSGSIIAANITEVSTVSVLTVTAPSVPVATTPFNPENAIMIDTPNDTYATLPTCIRFVMNGCKSPKDTTSNCQPIFPGNYSDIWSGLGVDLRCATTECICGGTKFDYSLQHAFDAASYLCQTAFPSVENPSPSFAALGEMLSAFCSDGGFVLDGWVLALVGASKQKGLDTGNKIGVAFGVASVIIPAVALFFPWRKWLKGRRLEKEAMKKEN